MSDNPTSNLLAIAIVSDVILLRQGKDILYWIVIILLQVLQQVANQQLENILSLYYGNSKNKDVQVCIL